MRSSTLIAVLAAGLLALPSAAAAEPGDVALTDTQREEFREAAAAAGLSGAEIDAALSDPVVLAATPVHVEVEETELQPLAMPIQPGLAGHSVVRATSRTRTMTYRNIWRARILSFTVWKYWEYDMHRVRAAPPARAWGSITRHGAAGGWEYKGVVSSSDHYVRSGGNPRGAHDSFRQGRFTHCAFKIGCVGAAHPRITIRGYYHGKSSSWGG